MISVLLIDKQPTFIEEVKMLLESQGDIKITSAESSKRALELLQKSPFDVIISDYQLPRIDGIGLIKVLRAHGDQTPVIIYAGKASGDTAIKAMRGGAELFLRKSDELESQLAWLKITVEEIVKRRRIEDRLYRRERDFRTIVEKNADAMVVIDRFGIIQFANPAALDLFYLPEHEMIGKLLGSPIMRHEPVDMNVIRGFKEVAAAEMRMVEVEWEGKQSYLISFRDVSRHVRLEEDLLKARDELETRVEERTSDLVAANYKLEREIEERMTVEEELKVEIEERSTAEEELTTELEKREKVEEALAEAKEHAELYLDLMGHDIRNLAQIAIGYLELALETDDPDEIKGLLVKPLGALQDTAQIIDNVRKLQSTKHVREGIKPVNLCQILTDLQTRYTTTSLRQVTVNLKTVPKCITIANELVIDVFSNLITNSIKHSDPEKVLTIDIRVDRIKEKDVDYLRCTVEDNGPGISNWVKDKIFMRFQRGDTKAHGKGLGLHIARTLVEDYGGKIWVEDRVSGDYSKGARFVVVLPAA